MKTMKKTVTLGLEYSLLAERRVRIDITYTYFVYNWFERVTMKLLKKVPDYNDTEHSKLTHVLIKQKMGFMLISTANRIWNLTDETIIKDRYIPAYKTGKIDKTLFDNAEIITIEKLVQDLDVAIRKNHD